MFDVRFHHPSTFTIAGPSQSGKTTFVWNLLRDAGELFTSAKCLQNVVYFYKEWQEGFTMFEQEDIVKHWVNDLPTIDDFKERTLPFKDVGGSIVIIDDFAQELNKDIATIFTVLSHHTNTTVILLTQNLFSKNPVYRDVSLNSTYIVLFKNPRDLSQISHFARQFQPGNHQYIIEAFKKCTKAPYSYMLFDHHQATSDGLRVRSNIFPKQWPVRVWMSQQQAKNTI
jgi:molybdopterin-guanine dinucleotide biosynthesis protein